MLPSPAARRRARRGRLALALLTGAVALLAARLVWLGLVALAGATLLALESALPARLAPPPGRDRRRDDRPEPVGTP